MTDAPDLLPPRHEPLTLDLVSDVVCPWCLVGFRQIERALQVAGLAARIRWHPFELNSTLPPGGQDLREHVFEKYGADGARSRANRETLTRIGAELGIAFRYRDDARIYNTFLAHQLIRHAGTPRLRHATKLTLMEAYFTEGRAVDEVSVLVEVAAAVGLDPAGARAALEAGTHADAVRAEEAAWVEAGVSGVPTVIVDGQQALIGAVGVEAYARLFSSLRAAA